MDQIKSWIFQANPAKYRIHDSLRFEKQELWNLNQHKNLIKAGDRVLVWISGAEAGIYAKGKVLLDPVLKPDSEKGLGYWRKPKDGKILKPRVLVEYDEIYVDNPILKIFLINDPELWEMDIIKSPRGTNFKVNQVEWESIQRWIKLQ